MRTYHVKNVFWAALLSLAVALGSARAFAGMGDQATRAVISEGGVAARQEAKQDGTTLRVSDLLQLTNPWVIISEGGAVVTETATTNGCQLTVTDVGSRAGMASSGMKTEKLRVGEWYDLNFDAQTEGKTFALTVSLESTDGKQVYARTTLPEIGRARQSYSVALGVRKAASQYRVVVTMAETGTIWLDKIALVRRNS